MFLELSRLTRIFLILFVFLLITVSGMAFLTTYTSLEFRSFFGKKSANIEREIFEQSTSYIQGKRQEASRLYLQYSRAQTDEDREAILGIIPIQFANFNEDEHLDGEIRSFIRRGKGFAD